MKRCFDAMAAGGDQFLYDVAERAVFSSLKDPETIRYRQRVLGDCRSSPRSSGNWET